MWLFFLGTVTGAIVMAVFGMRRIVTNPAYMTGLLMGALKSGHPHAMRCSRCGAREIDIDLTGLP